MYRAAIILPLLLLSSNCHAACDVVMSGSDTVSLVVESGGCFRSERERQAFATQLKQVVRTMDTGTSRSIDRKSTAGQLNSFGDLKRQAKYLSPPPPVYYGQR